MHTPPLETGRKKLSQAAAHEEKTSDALGGSEEVKEDVPV